MLRKIYQQMGRGWFGHGSTPSKLPHSAPPVPPWLSESKQVVGGVRRPLGRKGRREKCVLQHFETFFGQFSVQTYLVHWQQHEFYETKSSTTSVLY